MLFLCHEGKPQEHVAVLGFGFATLDAIQVIK
jgi:hypothetical protein